jgi:hypothetical protein
MAGFGDGGHGTYQVHRKVASIDEGCEEDEPATAELTECGYIFEDIVGMFDAGAHDAALGREKSPPIR